MSLNSLKSINEWCKEEGYDQIGSCPDGFSIYCFREPTEQRKFQLQFS